MAYTLPSLISPSLTDAFSALGKSTQNNSVSTPAVSSGSIPAIPTLKPYTVPSNLGQPSAAPLISSSSPSMNNMTSTPAMPSLTSGYNLDGQSNPNIFSPTVMSPNITTPSGNIVNPNTGALVSPGFAPPASQNQNNSQPSQTITPATPALNPTWTPVNTPDASMTFSQNSSTPATPATPATSSLDPNLAAALQTYEQSLQMSPQEVAAQQQLNDLNTSASQAYTNAEGQPIALPFITGQQAQIQREQSTLAQPLESELSLLQAQRQLQSQGSEAALEVYKPTALSYGGSLVQGGTGQTLNAGIFGDGGGVATGSTTTPPTSGSVQDILGYLSANGIDASRYNLVGLINAVQNGATAQDIISGRANVAGVAAATAVTDTTAPAAAKAAAIDYATATPTALSSALTDQTSYFNNTQRAFNTANDTLTALQTFMQTNGINSDSTTPAINYLQNRIKGGLTDPGAVDAFKAQLATLRQEYSQVLAKGGARSVSTDNEAAALIPDNLAPADFQKVIDQIEIDATNVTTDAQNQINQIQAQLNKGTGGAFSNNSSSSSNASSTDPLGIFQ